MTDAVAVSYTHLTDMDEITSAMEGLGLTI